MPATLNTPPPADVDRRSNPRYPVMLELQYRLLNRHVVVQSGHGYTVNLSSAGILFESDAAVKPGMKLELLISWPAVIDNRLGLTFWVTGVVVRRSRGLTAVALTRHEFRIRHSQPIAHGATSAA